MTTFKDVEDTVRYVNGTVTFDLEAFIAFGKQRGEDTSRLETVQDKAMIERVRRAREDADWDRDVDTMLAERERHVGMIADSLKRRA